MDFKRKIAAVTMDKRKLQKQSLQLKKSVDEVRKLLGDGKTYRNKK